jgi:hypothetical protein
LFLFEFTVVLLGVLAAQALQGWFAQRQELRTARAAKATLDRNIKSIAYSAEVRQRGLACFGQRLGAVAGSLRDGSPPPILTAPEEALVIDLGWSGQTPALIAEHYGSKVADQYANAALWTDALRVAQAREQESWTDLARLSPRLGLPNEADRSAAKGAVIDASRDLLHISWAAGHMLRHARDFKALPELSELAGYREAKDPCKRAMAFTLEQHRRAAEQGRLVTGEALAR